MENRQFSGWHTSSYTNGGGECVEVGYDQPHDVVGVRDTKLGAASPIKTFPKAGWLAFIDAVKSGDVAAR